MCGVGRYIAPIDNGAVVLVAVGICECSVCAFVDARCVWMEANEATVKEVSVEKEVVLLLDP